jgi:hypothetical protein
VFDKEGVRRNGIYESKAQSCGKESSEDKESEIWQESQKGLRNV